MPFILTSPSSANFTLTAVTKLHQEPWLGKLELEDAGRWIDDILLLVRDPQENNTKIYSAININKEYIVMTSPGHVCFEHECPYII